MSDQPKLMWMWPANIAQLRKLIEDPDIDLDMRMAADEIVADYEASSSSDALVHLFIESAGGRLSGRTSEQ